jgi:hypothetical protein
MVEIGTLLENQAFENWKAWASGQTAKADLARGSTYTSTDDDISEDSIEGDGVSRLPPSQLPESSLPKPV